MDFLTPIMSNTSTKTKMGTLSNNNSALKSSISDFLYTGNLIQLIVAVYLGTVLQNFFSTFVDGIIMPLLILFIPNSKFNKFSEIQIEILGVRLKIGELIISLIKMFIGFIVTYIFVVHFVFKYLKK